MRHASLVLAALLVAPIVASCDGAPTPPDAARLPAEGIEIRRTGTANSSATGVAQYTSGASNARLSFIVSNNGSSVTTGWAMYRTSANFGQVFYIEIDCLQVSGGQAWMSGTVIDSSDGSMVGWDAGFKVVDGSPDEASLVNFAASDGAACNTQPEIDTVTIGAGLVTVS